MKKGKADQVSRIEGLKSSLHKDRKEKGGEEVFRESRPQRPQETEQRSSVGGSCWDGETAPRGGAVLFDMCHLFALEVRNLDPIDGDKYKSHGKKIEDARAKRQLGSGIGEERDMEGGEAGTGLTHVPRTFGGVGAAVTT